MSTCLLGLPIMGTIYGGETSIGYYLLTFYKQCGAMDSSYFFFNWNGFFFYPSCLGKFCFGGLSLSQTLASSSPLKLTPSMFNHNEVYNPLISLVDTSGMLFKITKGFLRKVNEEYTYHSFLSHVVVGFCSRNLKCLYFLGRLDNYLQLIQCLKILFQLFYPLLQVEILLLDLHIENP